MVGMRILEKGLAGQLSYEALEKKVRQLELELAECQRENLALKTEEQQYKNLFNHTLYEIHIWRLCRDEAGRISTWCLVDANPRALQSWGKKLEDIVGKCTDEIFPDANATEVFMPIVEKIFNTREPFVWESYFDGTDQTLQMISIPFDEYFISTGIDISELTRAQAALRLSMAKVEAASDAKSQFLANMSHEIRTPLNAIVGLVYLVENTNLDAKQKYDLARIKEAGCVLLSLIDDVLDFSKIESGKMSLTHEPFSLRDLVDEMASVFSAMCEKKGLRLDLPDVEELRMKHLVGDAVRVRQILINLLGNAVKFTSAGFVALKLVIKTLGANEAMLQIEVSDSGIGLDEATQRTLFEAFTQADASTTRIYGGSGLGLAIVRALCQVMGGDITVRSQPDVGSTFIATLRLGLPAEDLLPQCPQRAPEEQSSDAQPVPLAARHILLVDDNELNREITQAVLELDGAVVVSVENGKLAVEWLQDHADEIDAVLMDIQMPVMDGNTATKHIRQELKLTALPIIGLSAGALNSERQRAISAGMDDYLTKPIDPIEIRECILRLTKYSG